MSDLLDAFRKDKEAMAALNEARKIRPIVPSFSLCKTKDEQEMMVEAIKYHAAMQQGFDLLYQYLTGQSFNNVKEIKDGRRNADA